MTRSHLIPSVYLQTSAIPADFFVACSAACTFHTSEQRFRRGAVPSQMEWFRSKAAFTPAMQVLYGDRAVSRLRATSFGCVPEEARFWACFSTFKTAASLADQGER